jgi:multicomponent Na+:H+ antiporter subunit F
MITTLVQISMLALGAAVLAGFWRLWRGPTVVDRMLAFDLITVCGVGWIAMLCLRWQTDLFVELVLVYSLLGFLGTVAFALYLNKTIAPRAPGDTDRGETSSIHD